MDWRIRKIVFLKYLTFSISILVFLFVGKVNTSTAITEGPGLQLSTTISAVNDTNSSTTTTNTTEAPQTVTTTKQAVTTPDTSYLGKCPTGASCEDLGSECIVCKLNHYCVYGEISMANCTVKPNISCIGERTFKQEYHCRYAYQLDKDLYNCDIYSLATSCTVKTAPLELYTAQCTVRDDVMCLGNRTFHQKFPCNWTSGYKWSTALVLSITLGGFGVDRFYLGLWREGIGKLFSFGGLGVWTILDVILIAVGYVGPYDGSLYIYPWD